MRRLRVAPLFLLCVVGGATVHARDFDSSLRAAMHPYYAALVASARGDADGTRRQLVLFQAKWSAVEQERQTMPPALARDPQWPGDLARITAVIGRAQALLRTRDVEGAHAELELIRSTLRDARQRHGLATIDDAVLEFHDALERLVGRVPHRNEIRLKHGDFADLKALVDASHREWSAVCRKADESTVTAAWQAARGRIDGALRDVASAVEREDSAALSAAAAALKNGYFELLLRM